MNYKDLRKKYPIFVYRKYDYKIDGDDLLISFLFAIDPDIVFAPTLRFKNISQDRLASLDKAVFNNFAFHLGLAEIPSYWKSTCSSKIIIEAGYLDNYQLDWWKDLILNGMGQFFYENKIDFTSPDFISLSSTSKNSLPFSKNSSSSGVLIPVGGGKDSAVTLELLKDFPRAAAFLVNPTKAALDTVRLSGLKEQIVVERNIDDKLSELNKKGYLNGHTPFSSVIAYLSSFAAYLYGYKDIALSNERSSDEENTEYLDRKINHQYSKTFEFENKFREYLDKYLSDANYFSFLRPVYEIQIAKIFSNMDKYFNVIRSCNVGQKTNTWCSNCSKCLSTYILLKPFLGPEKTNKIFGEDLVHKPELKGTLSELIDDGKVKPFECVGTREELKIALQMEENSDNEILSSWNDKNNLSGEYQDILKKHL